MEQEPKRSWHDTLPFPKHWLAYVVLKIIVLVAAVWLTLYLYGVL
jgi:hypothetical protein